MMREDEESSVDRGWAWVVLAASFGILVFVGSSLYGTGVIYVFLLDTFGEDPVKTSWVGALSSSLCSLVGPIAGILASRTNCRAAIMIGGLMTVVGYSASAFVQDFNLLFLTYGLLVGAGTGIAYTPAVVVLGYYFDKKRDMACGLAIAGCGIGMMAGPMIIRFLTDVYGWRGMFLLMGGISFHICLFGALCFPGNIEMEQKFLRQEYQTNSSMKNNFNIFTNVSFLILILSVFLYNFACSAILLHFPNYSITEGATTQEVTLLLMVTSIASIISRVLSGLGSTSGPANKYLLYFGSYGLVAITVLTFPLYSASVTGRYVFSGFFGLYTTVCFAVLNPITVELVGLFDLALAFGIEMLVCGLGFLLGPPVAALVVQYAGDYSVTLYLTGVMMMISSFLGMLVMVFKQPLDVLIEETTVANIAQSGVLSITPADLLRSLASIPGIVGTSKENLSLSVLSLAHKYPSILTIHDKYSSILTLSHRHSVISIDNLHQEPIGE